MRPCEHRATATLLPGVRAEDLRTSAGDRQAVQDAGDRQSPEGPRREDRHGLMGGVVDAGQARHDPPIRRAIEDDVRGPDLVTTLGAHQWLAVGYRDLLAPSALQLEPGLCVRRISGVANRRFRAVRSDRRSTGRYIPPERPRGCAIPCVTLERSSRPFGHTPKRPPNSCSQSRTTQTRNDVARRVAAVLEGKPDPGQSVPTKAPVPTEIETLEEIDAHLPVDVASGACVDRC